MPGLGTQRSKQCSLSFCVRGEGNVSLGGWCAERVPKGWMYYLDELSGVLQGGLLADLVHDLLFGVGHGGLSVRLFDAGGSWLDRAGFRCMRETLSVVRVDSNGIRCRDRPRAMIACERWRFSGVRDSGISRRTCAKTWMTRGVDEDEEETWATTIPSARECMQNLFDRLLLSAGGGGATPYLTVLPVARCAT